jgi:hypothetical protein
VRARTRLARPVARTPLKFFALGADYEAVLMAGIWLPSRLEVRSDFRAAVTRRRHHNEYQYFYTARSR